MAAFACPQPTRQPWFWALVRLTAAAHNAQRFTSPPAQGSGGPDLPWSWTGPRLAVSSGASRAAVGRSSAVVSVAGWVPGRVALAYSVIAATGAAVGHEERRGRALFTVLPAASHLRPALPLAHAMAARGWDVAVAASPSMDHTVRDAGLAFFPVGLDWLESDAAATFPELRTMPLDEQAYWWVSDLFADRVARPAARDLVELLGAWQPDVVVRDYWDFGAWAAAEAAEVPTAVVGLAMFTPADEWAAFIGLQLTRLREEVGLSPDGSFASLYGGPYVDLLPPTYQSTRPPNRIGMTPVARPTGSPSTPSWQPPGARDATVLVTFGTVFNKVPGVFESVIAALADEPVDVVVTTGRDLDPASLGPLPDNTSAHVFLPYDEVLPSCDAVVCHAGFGTTMAALAHDLPIVAVPLSADQGVHAARCGELGLGQVVPWPDPAPDAIRAAVRDVLDDPSSAARAALVGREVRAMPTAATATHALEAALA